MLVRNRAKKERTVQHPPKKGSPVLLSNGLCQKDRADRKGKSVLNWGYLEISREKGD